MLNVNDQVSDTFAVTRLDKLLDVRRKGAEAARSRETPHSPGGLVGTRGPPARGASLLGFPAPPTLANLKETRSRRAGLAPSSGRADLSRPSIQPWGKMATLRTELRTYAVERDVPCLLCGQFFPQPSVAVVLFDGPEQLGDICPPCLAAGPEQMAARLRERVARMRSQAHDLQQEPDRPGTRGAHALQLVSRATALLPLADALEKGGLAVLRVLVVAGDREAAASLAGLVRLWGHDAQVTPGGASAVAVAGAFQPHVLLLDLGRPPVDVLQLRQQANLKEAIVVALTGHADPVHPGSWQEAGFDHYLVKPVTPDLLEALLKMVRSVKHLGTVADTVKAGDTLKVGTPAGGRPAGDQGGAV